MKIGIMSMQRVVNYGSFLQAYALQNTIKKLGHDVEFVDYTVEPCVCPLQTSECSTNGLKNRAKENLRNIKWGYLKKYSGKKFESYEQFSNDYREIYMPLIGVSDEKNISPYLDCLVIGSDEVFNCLQNNENVGYSKELFGARANAPMIISYAASFGSATIQGLRKYNIADEISKMLLKFKAISVRDYNSKAIVSELTEREPNLNIDPVLVYNFDAEINSAEIKHRYEKFMIVYAYPGRITKEEKKAIRSYARKNGLKIIAIGVICDFCDECIFPTPFEVLRLFKEAECVVTDTFHGSVISIKYNKQFVSFVRSQGNIFTNGEKLGDLLKQFGLEARIARYAGDLEEVLNNKIDYAPVNQQLENEYNKSIEYLVDNIGQAK
ncbi:MAG: polysaccharide pyruvyl transferase family protein [Lachnospiraceae bacterium]|nr:polysaccharide pyruvyl transferase family protein [Lachnospiraceae bacterium]